jgi:hypothetical protein
MSGFSRVLAIGFAAALVGGGIAVGGYLVGSGIVDARTVTRNVTVKGVAEQEATADLATWSLGITVPDPDVVAGERRLATHVEAVVAFFADAGFAPEEITVERLYVRDTLSDAYRERVNREVRYILGQTVRLRTTKIAAVRALSGRTGELVRRGMVINDHGGPHYIVTVEQLNRVKPDLIRRATLAAKTAAGEFAASSGSRVGNIRNANQGVIQILARDDAAAEPNSPEKRLRAVTTLDYLLVD